MLYSKVTRFAVTSWRRDYERVSKSKKNGQD